jgi:hypothetical protein
MGHPSRLKNRSPIQNSTVATRLERCEQPNPQPLPQREGETGREGERYFLPEKVLTGTQSRIFSFLMLGAGVTPAEGSVKPTAGFIFNSFLSLIFS